MADISKISPDDGSTILNIKDSKAVHWVERDGYVGKNLLQNNAVSKITGNVTYTVNADKSITGNGTANSNANLEICHINLIQGVKYRLSGGNRLQFYYAPDYTQLNINGGSDTEFTAPQTGEYIAYFRCGNGETLNNVTIYPMLRLASVSDSTYEPYLTPNTEINNKVSYKDNTILGAKNILRNTASSGTDNGVTYTVNADGTVNTNTSEISANSRLVVGKGIKLKKGTYTLNGCPSGGAEDKYFIRLAISDSSTTDWGIAVGKDYGDGYTFTVSDESKYYDINLYIINGYTSTNPTFSPMLRLASDTDDTYVPYSMTNRELTNAVIPIVTDVKTTFKNLCLAATDTTITDVTNAYLIKMGKLVVFVARINKAANTVINMTVDISSIFPYTLAYNEAHPTLLSAVGGGSGVMANDKKLYFRYTTADSATYVDMTMIAFVK